MKITPFKSHLADFLAALALALPAGFAFGQTALPAPSGVNLQNTGNITNGPAVTLPNSISATPIAPAFSWEGSNLLQGFVLPVSNFTGLTTTGGTVNYEDLLPLKATKLQVMQGAAGAAPSGVSTLIDATGIDTASVITDVLKVKDSSTGTDATLTVVNGKLEANSVSMDAQTLSLSGNTLSISGGNSVSLPASGGSGTVTNVASGTGLSGGPITSTGTLSLANTAVTAGNYGSASTIPTFTVDAQGRLTEAASVALPDDSASNELQNLSVSGSTMNISGGTGATIPNLYTADGTLTASRTVTMGTNNLSFSATSGDALFNFDDNAPAFISLVNSNAGADALSMLQLGNDTAGRLTLFQNSSTRTVEGGVNTATLRNDAGSLRLQSQGQKGLTIFGGTGFAQWDMQRNGQGGMWIRNTSAGDSAYSSVFIGNNTANNLRLFLNSSNKSDDGAENTATLRNDAGDLRLQGAGSHGLTVFKNNGDTRLENNDSTATGRSLFQLKNGSNFVQFFVNSSLRTAEGGVNTATLRNDSGDLRLMAGTNTLTISPTGSSTFSSDAFAPAFVNTSDKRLKEKVTATHYGIGDVMKMQVVDYRYIADPQKAHTGFLAQDLHKVYPEAVVVGGSDPKQSPWGVDYAKLTPLLTKSIQELQRHVESLEAEKKAQSVKLAAQAKEIAALKKTQTAEIAQIKAALEQMRQLVVLKTADKAAAKNAVSAR